MKIILNSLTKKYKDRTVVNNLSSTLASIFPETKGVIHQIVSFDDKTSGFKLGQFSMMVALGYDNLALIQTGVGATFFPVQKFLTSDPGKNVFSFLDPSLF